MVQCNTKLSTTAGHMVQAQGLSTVDRTGGIPVAVVYVVGGDTVAHTDGVLVTDVGLFLLGELKAAEVYTQVVR